MSKKNKNWLFIIFLIVLWMLALRVFGGWEDIFLFSRPQTPRISEFIAYTNDFIEGVWLRQAPVVDIKMEVSKSWIKSLIISTAKEWGINPDSFLDLAICESRLNPNAKNKYSSASGIFQFIGATWDRIIIKLNKPEWDIFNPVHNITAAAYLLTKEGPHHWKNCWNKIMIQR